MARVAQATGRMKVLQKDSEVINRIMQKVNSFEPDTTVNSPRSNDLECKSESPGHFLESLYRAMGLELSNQASFPGLHSGLPSPKLGSRVASVASEKQISIQKEFESLTPTLGCTPDPVRTPVNTVTFSNTKLMHVKEPPLEHKTAH